MRPSTGRWPRSLRERAARLVPGVAALEPDDVWVGFRPWLPDHRPAIGPSEAVPGLWVGTGHEGAGVALGPITGRLLAQGITGEATRTDLAPFHRIASADRPRVGDGEARTGRIEIAGRRRAPRPPPEPPARASAKRRPLEDERSIACAVQAASPIAPAWPVRETACAPVNVVVPKAASAPVAHCPPPEHSDGASTIHSAEVTSTAEARSVLVNDVPRVRFLMVMVVRVPLTATPAWRRSPAARAIRALCEMSGTSSYQVEYTARPAGVQSASVPICSRAVDVPR